VKVPAETGREMCGSAGEAVEIRIEVTVNLVVDYFSSIEGLLCDAVPL
jgi:hypothetical protein